jgi:hypothetical protein
MSWLAGWLVYSREKCVQRVNAETLVAYPSGMMMLSCFICVLQVMFVSHHTCCVLAG